MKWFSYAWTALKGLVGLFIAYALLNAFSEPFQRVVVSLLILIYISVRFSALGQSVNGLANLNLSLRLFKALITATGHEEVVDGDFQQQLQKNDDDLHQASMQLLVHTAFYALTFLFVLVRLLTAF